MIESQPGSESRFSTEGSQPPAAATPPPFPPSESAPPLAASVPENAELAGWGLWRLAPSWLASTVLHLVFIIALAAVTIARAPVWHPVPAPTVVGSAERDDAALEDALPPPPPDDEATGSIAKGFDEVLTPAATGSPGDPGMEVASPLLPSTPLLESPHPALALPSVTGGGVGTRSKSGSGRRGAGAPKGRGRKGTGLGEAPDGTEGAAAEAFAGRMDSAKRAQLVKLHGGSFESETAVSRALYWLSKHQYPDGSWRFDHRASADCDGQCGNPGTYPGAEIASSGFALLPFLGAGETHLKGDYQRNVRRGLSFLIESMGNDGSLWQESGKMYSHGLASIALCEAYGMTRDPQLRRPAQMAVNFIVAAQDQKGGGWRYNPGMAGDTSIFGWQLMALTSARMAYLDVPDQTIVKANYFLDGVQAADGAMYMYMNPGGPPDRESTCSIGLLCRMYLGWKRDHPPFLAGVQRLSAIGPACFNAAPTATKPNLQVNMYYNYYGTQLMFHYGGDTWTRWNEKMRDFLVKSQATQGHESGSWYFNSGYDYGPLFGGRLYCTAMAAMTLEVYYRHLPLYSELSVKDPFH